jgi:uncharacterized protein (TIGR03083 family)
MTDADIERWIADGRRELADVLDRLTPAQWRSPSLCEGWAIRDVVAHITMPFRFSVPRFVLEMVRSGGSFNDMADRVARRDGAQPTEALVHGLRANAGHPWNPPGGGKVGALTHDLVHGLDITRPLGIEWAIPPERFRPVLDNLVTRKSLRFFGVGIDADLARFQAGDLDWSYGSGDLVTAPAADLVLMLTARPFRKDSFSADWDLWADAGDGG